MTKISVGTPTPPPAITPPVEGGLITIEGLVGSIIGAVLFLIGAVALLSLVYGGFLFMTAGGDSEKTTKARNIILYALLGVLVVAISYLLVYWASGAGGELFDFFMPASE